MTDADRLLALRRAIPVADEAARRAAFDRHGLLAKPAGSLGRLEDLGAQLAAVAGAVPPPLPERPAVVVFAADHGVHDEGVSPWPQAVTALMVRTFRSGGAAVNALAEVVGATVAVIDVGVAERALLPADVDDRRVAGVTANLRTGPAMSRTDAIAALLVGADVAAATIAGGADLLVGGEMGIGNTTAAAAVIAACTGAPAEAVTGRGTGIDDATLQRKIGVVADALLRSGPPADPVDVLAELGGHEIAALAGFYLAGAAARVPVVVDGVIALAGACIAGGLAPPVVGSMIAGHRSTEPAATLALAHLGLEPVLDLGMRLGEGSGALLAVPVIRSAAAVLGRMAALQDVVGPAPH